MKQAFVKKLRLNKENTRKLGLINTIVEEYRAQGYKLTLRQLYYQLVARDIIPNRVQEYAKLSKLLTQGRMAGIVDWSAIEDRLRVPYLPFWVLGKRDALETIKNQYRLDRMKGQDVYIEVWVEKDALSGVLKRITRKYHVNLMVNRGYSSTTAMYDAFKRIRNQEDLGKKSVILYLGDHDSSGLDMVRDIKERLEVFGVDPEILHIGITMEQIRKLSPPPNPAKLTDPRASWYIEKFGSVSWEVDALPPEFLNKLLEKQIEARIDIDKYNEQLEKEEADKEDLDGLKDDFEDED